MNASTARTRTATSGRRAGNVASRSVALVTALCVAATSHAGETAPWAAVAKGDVVLLRHAEAPGVGDPSAFRLDDCATQRNLDARGRHEARRIGEAFRAHGVHVGAVLTSRWCRAKDTATLAFPDIAVRDEPAFDSFFTKDDTAAAQTAAARAIVARWAGPGALVVVTHQVNITALTGVVPVAGEAVVVRLTAKGLEVAGRLRLAP